MREYPTNLSPEDFNRYVSQLRTEDIAEFNRNVQRQHFDNGFYPKSRVVSSNTTLGLVDYMVDVDTSGGDVTVTLPDVKGIRNKVVVIAKSKAGNTLTIDGGSKNINGSATLSVTTQFWSYNLQFIQDANEWRVISAYLP